MAACVIDTTRFVLVSERLISGQRTSLGSDFTPYLGNVMPGLRLTLTDPVPDVRATAAKAIGEFSSCVTRRD